MRVVAGDRLGEPTPGEDIHQSDEIAGAESQQKVGLFFCLVLKCF